MLPLPAWCVYAAVTQQYSLPLRITPVCFCQTLVIVSCTQCRLIVSPLFIQKCSWMLQSGPAMELLLWGFAVNINIYLHRAVGILMGGLGSLLRLWNKITWCAEIPINAVTESYISFLEHNNHLWGSSVASLKNLMWFLLTEKLLAVKKQSIFFLLMWIPDAVFCCDLYLAAGCGVCAVP